MLPLESRPHNICCVMLNSFSFFLPIKWGIYQCGFGVETDHLCKQSHKQCAQFSIEGGRGGEGRGGGREVATLRAKEKREEMRLWL